MPSDLLTPYTFRCGRTTPNRLALAAMTNTQSDDDGTCTDEEHAWLTRRAEGGFGLIATCAAHVSPTAKGFDGQLGVFDDRLVPGLTRLAAGVQAFGGLGVVQLYHGGVRCPSRLTGQQPVSASRFVEDKPGFEVPRPLADHEIEAIIADFVAAARRSAAAGFAGVEVHGAHGYLLTQFLSSTMNLRADRWGGGWPGRATLIRAVTRAVRQAVPGLVVGVRISPEDGGFSLGVDLDESLQLAGWLAEDGADFVHISLWDAVRNTQKRTSEHPIPLFRQALPARVALIAAGGIWTRDDAQRAADHGADIVAIGRAAILDPDWPLNVARDGYAPVRGPLSPGQLGDVAVSPKFAEYLRRFRTLVAN